MEDALDGKAPTALSALDVQVAADRRGEGIAAVALNGLREQARDSGLDRLVVPVRPTGKTRHPMLSMEEYLSRRREEPPCWPPPSRTSACTSRPTCGWSIP